MRTVSPGCEKGRSSSGDQDSYRRVRVPIEKIIRKIREVPEGSPLKKELGNTNSCTSTE